MPENDAVRAMLSPAVTFETADMSKATEFAAWALAALPSTSAQMGDVALHPSIRPALSERLHKLGFRHHADEQVEFPLPGDHPEAGYLNVPTWVDREAYETYWEGRTPEADFDAWSGPAKAILAAANPALAKQLDTMTDEEKAAERERQKASLPAAFRRLAEIAEQAKADTETTEGDQ